MGEIVANRYRLDIVIGSGGMGTVWRGYDEMLHRPVAIKELHLPAQLSEAARAEAVARALTEARHAARLQHPGIVSVYDIAEHDGRPWIVMQLVEGVSLFQHVRQHGPVPPAEAARIGVAVLDALAAAHAAGVIHRDVKPSNVLLGPRGEVLLTDFSIAYAIGSVTMTNTGVVLGSPGYVAPERISGGRTGPATDLFGLGATLFFLVEGVGPFDHEDPLAALLASATQPHPRPRNAGPITPVIDGLLAKDPAQRMTARAAADALARIAGRAPIPPIPDPAAGLFPPIVAGPATTTGRRPLPAGGPPPHAGPAPRAGAPPLAGPAPLGGPPPLAGPAPLGGPPPLAGPPPHAGPPRAQRRPMALPRPVGPGETDRRRRRTRVLAAVGAVVAVLLITGGVLLALRPKQGTETARPPTSTGSVPATDAVLGAGTAIPSTVATEPSTAEPAPTTEVTTAGGNQSNNGGQPNGGGQPTGGAQPTGGGQTTTASQPTDDVDDPPVIESVTVSPSTVCYGRFTITMVAHDDSGEMTAGYEYTISYPDGSGERWGGGLNPGPNNTWTAEVGRPGDNGLFRQPGSTIQGFVSAYDGVNVPPVTKTFPVVINVVNC